MWLSLFGKWCVLTLNWNLLLYISCTAAIPVGTNGGCIRKVNNGGTGKRAAAAYHKAARYSLVRYCKGIVTHGCPYRRGRHAVKISNEYFG